ncbi:MAG: hypothetical protein QOI36_3592 [Pseudonocardiales bacterium]|jgi:hypothetical protein|nr:hypothetical protein [Pseudonocardiales bacterium]
MRLPETIVGHTDQDPCPADPRRSSALLARPALAGFHAVSCSFIGWRQPRSENRVRSSARASRLASFGSPGTLRDAQAPTRDIVVLDDGDHHRCHSGRDRRRLFGITLAICYVVTAVIFVGFFLVVLALQIRAKRFNSGIFGPVVLVPGWLRMGRAHPHHSPGDHLFGVVAHWANAILVSNTLGTASGDWLSNDTGLGSAMPSSCSPQSCWQSWQHII